MVWMPLAMPGNDVVVRARERLWMGTEMSRFCFLVLLFYTPYEREGGCSCHSYYIKVLNWYLVVRLTRLNVDPSLLVETL